MSEKRYPISDLKRDNLRKAGVVALSRELSALGSVITLGVLCGVLLSSGFAEHVVKIWSTLDHDSASVATVLQESFLSATKVLFICLAIASFIYTLGHLLQSGFLFRPGLLFSGIAERLGFGRLFSFSFAEGLFLLIAFIVWSGVSYLTINLLLYELSEIKPESYFQLDPIVSKEVLAERFDSLIGQVLPLVLGIVVLASFLLGVIIFLVRKIAFDAKYMMTRQEVEQEAKEYEVDQNMKRAQYERSNS